MPKPLGLRSLRLTLVEVDEEFLRNIKKLDKTNEPRNAKVR